MHCISKSFYPKKIAKLGDQIEVMKKHMFNKKNYPSPDIFYMNPVCVVHKILKVLE